MEFLFLKLSLNNQIFNQQINQIKNYKQILSKISSSTNK
jgi:hypothetical protein